MLKIHHNISPLDAWVSKEFLTGNRATGKVPCKITALSFYPGSTPTFTVVLEDGSLFNYVPANKIWHMIGSNDDLDLTDLSYENCPAENFVVHVFDIQSVFAYFKRKQIWVSGTYICTVDWYTGNQSLNLLKLDTGHFAWVPNHKMNLRQPVLNTEYRKIKEVFSVK